jgi:small subunit ribosomal protein S20
MANHKSSKKRARQNTKRRIHNRYYLKSARTVIRKLRGTEEVDQAEKLLPLVVSKIDRLVKKNLFHKNKASNLKSKLQKFVNGLKKAA